MLRRPAHRLALGLVAAAALAAALPAAPSSAASNGYQFDGFRLAGGTRFTLTVSRAAAVPGLPTAGAPKGYRRLCSATGPFLRARLNWSGEGDLSGVPEHLYTSRPGAGSYTELGAGREFGDAPIVTAGPVPRAVTVAVPLLGLGTPVTSVAIGAKIVTLPAPALYDLIIVPWSTTRALSPPMDLPVTLISAKLDIHLDTTGCPLTTSDPFPVYVRAA